MADASEQPQSDSNDTGTAVAAPPKPKTVPPRVDKLPPWRVLLHNDSHNEMGDVVLAIRMVVRLPAEEAFARMIEAHEKGLALLVETHREHAELLVEQFATFNMTVTAEPA